jgi:2-polyprenyl-3-methyl-5-hydroxy-6-metoxy-1,4-benzoquinol methylase
MKKFFNENEIRPKDLIDGQKIAMHNDIKYLRSFSSEYVNVKCPACGSIKNTLKYKKYDFDIVECAKCKTNYTNPRPTSKILGDFYNKSQSYDFWNKFIFPASEDVRREKIFKKRVDNLLAFCEKYGSTNGSLLDVGAGYGTFCEELICRNVFDKVVAVEPTPSLSETCKSKGIETISKPIEEVQFSKDEKFDVVVNFEVIEHLFSPKEFILQCKKTLKNNGLFLLTCPNGQGFDIITLKEVSNSIDHEHINYFNPNSIRILFNSCGFEVLEVLTPGVLDAEIVRNAVLEGNFNLDNQPFLKNIIIDDWENKGEQFQQYLIDNNMSSNMWVVARKITD